MNIRQIVYLSRDDDYWVLAVLKWTMIAMIAVPVAAVIMGIPQGFMTPFEAHCAEIGGTVVPAKYISGWGTVYECEVLP